MGSVLNQSQMDEFIRHPLLAHELVTLLRGYGVRVRRPLSMPDAVLLERDGRQFYLRGHGSHKSMPRPMIEHCLNHLGLIGGDDARIGAEG